MFSTLLQVAIGGAIGAAGRHLAGVLAGFAFGVVFPWGVLAVNIVGSFLMGVFVGLAAQKSLTHLAPFVMTGVLGGFTTFSAFSLDTVTLFERGQVGGAALYVLLSVGGAIGALFAGLALARGFWV